MTWVTGVIVALPVILLITTALLRRSRVSDASGPIASARAHPVAARLLFFSAGVKPEILQRASTDEGIYLGMGSMVVATSFVAASSMFVALSVAYERYHISRWAFLPIAITYGMIIYTIDRLLVSVQMNPIRFLSARGVPTEPVVARTSAARIIATLVIAIPRVLLAVIVGFMIAEPVLLTLFDNEVGKRVERIQENAGEQAARQVEADYEDDIETLSQPDPRVAQRDDYQAEVDSLQKQLDTANATVESETALAKAENKGTSITVGGTTTTGKSKCAEKCHEHLLKADLARGDARRINTELSAKRARLDELKTQVDAAEKKRQDDLDTLLKDTIPKAKEEAKKEAMEVGGLLLRIEALHQITTDDHPYAAGPVVTQERVPTPTPTNGVASQPEAAATDESNNPSSSASSTTTRSPTSEPSPGQTQTPAAAPAAAISGPSASHHIFGLTTLGLTVWLVRIWLILIDALPVLLKVALALRPRRPYDTAVAGEEEHSLSRSSREADKDRAAAFVTKRNLLVSATEGRPPRLFAKTPAGVVLIQDANGVSFSEDGTPQSHGADLERGVTVDFRDGLNWRVRPTPPKRTASRGGKSVINLPDDESVSGDEL